jgi:hypothetical protein
MTCGHWDKAYPLRLLPFANLSRDEVRALAKTALTEQPHSDSLYGNRDTHSQSRIKNSKNSSTMT